MRKALLILLCVVFVIGGGTVILHWYGSRIGGPVYDPTNSRDVALLQGIAQTSRPLREGLERFRNNQGGYPSVVTNLFPTYLQPAPEPTEFHWSGWLYLRETTSSYSLYYKLNWDDGLFYEHQVQGTNRWYVAGNKYADLTGEFQRN